MFVAKHAFRDRAESRGYPDKEHSSGGLNPFILILQRDWHGLRGPRVAGQAALLAPPEKVVVHRQPFSSQIAHCYRQSLHACPRYIY
jgi:hypothetical protein